MKNINIEKNFKILDKLNKKNPERTYNNPARII